MLLSAAPLLQTPPVKRAARDVHRPPVVLRERPHGAAAEIGTRRVAAVAGERRADDLEPAAAREDRAAPAALLGRPGGVAVREGQVLHDQPGRGLVVAVRRGPRLLRVAGVLVEDAALPAAAEGDQAAAVEHDAPAGVHHLGGPPQLDPDRVGPAAEPDDPALRDGPHDRARGAAPRRAVADPAVGMRGVDGPRLPGHADRGRRAGRPRRPGAACRPRGRAPRRRTWATGGSRTGTGPRRHRSPREGSGAASIVPAKPGVPVRRR